MMRVAVLPRCCFEDLPPTRWLSFFPLLAPQCSCRASLSLPGVVLVRGAEGSIPVCVSSSTLFRLLGHFAPPDRQTKHTRNVECGRRAVVLLFFNGCPCTLSRISIFQEHGNTSSWKEQPPPLVWTPVQTPVSSLARVVLQYCFGALASSAAQTKK